MVAVMRVLNLIPKGAAGPPNLCIVNEPLRNTSVYQVICLALHAAIAL